MSAEFFPKFINALEKSEAGASLKTTYRWAEHFRTSETDEDWRNIFGATGRVFSHSILFFKLMEQMVARENGRFIAEKQETLLYGTAPHDAGEAKINGMGVGDISAQDKTEADEKKEVVIARRVINSLELPAELKSKLLSSYYQVVVGRDQELYEAFKALEKSEYVLTAMKVYQNCKKLMKEGRPGLALEEALVGRVLVKDLTKVLDVYAPRFPNSIGVIFKTGAPLIDEMFAYSLPWLQTHDTWKGKPEDHLKLASEFRTKWETFKNKQINKCHK